MKRATVLIALMLACVTFAPQAAAQSSRPELLQGASAIESNPALEEWVNFYYLHPRPDLAVSAWKWMSQAQLFADEDMRPGLMAFFARLMHDNPGLGKKLLAASHDEASRFVLAYAAWVANAADSTEVLDALKASAPADQVNGLNDMVYSTPPDLLKKPITSEWDLDGLWSSFFASGDGRYVERIASTLALAGKEDPASQSIASEAKRTLLKNGREHARVREICNAELAHANAPEKDALAEVVKEMK